MPQKQPPAITAVCWPLVDAIGTSTAGVGRVPFVLSPALHAVTPAHVSTKMTADKRETKLDITNSLAASASKVREPVLLESGERQKLQAFDPVRERTT